NFAEGCRNVSRAPKNESFVRHHSLSLAASGMLLWICLYTVSDDSTHLGSFFGNAIADWSGMLVTILATKFMYEKGSAESREPPPDSGWVGSAWKHIRDHSLTYFFLSLGGLDRGLYKNELRREVGPSCGQYRL